MPDAPEGGHITQAGALLAGAVTALPDPEPAELGDELADETLLTPDRLPVPPADVPVPDPVAVPPLVVPTDAVD